MAPTEQAARPAGLVSEPNRCALRRHHPRAWRRILDGLPPSTRPEPDGPASPAGGPPGLAATLVSEAGAADASVAVVFGFGDGRLVAETLRAAPPAARVVVAVIDPAAFHEALRRTDLSEALTDPRLSLAVGSLREIAGALPRGDATIAVVADDRVLAGTAPSLTPLAHMAAELRARRRSHLVQRADVLANVAGNLDAILDAPAAGELASAAGGRPALLVAPGPSLDGQLGLLAESARPFTVALDTSARALVAAGVEPDLVVTLDPSLASLSKFERLPDGLPLVFFEGARPEAVARHGRRLFACERGGLLDRAHPFFGRGGTFASEGTVLVAALDVLLGVGASPVVLVGADLAPDGDRLHAGARGAARATPRAVPARGGGTVRVTESLWRHLRRVTRRAAAEPAGRVLDATTRGAEIRGVPRVGLGRVLAGAASAGREAARNALHRRLAEWRPPHASRRRPAAAAALAALAAAHPSHGKEDR